MAYATLPAFTEIGVAVQATLVSYNATTTAFRFTVGTTQYAGTWNTDVIDNAIGTLPRTVGSSGRLNLRAAKAAALHLSGVRSVGANYGGTDFSSYTLFSASVRTVSGNTVKLTIGGADYTIDWGNPAHIWLGAETSIVKVVGSAGNVRLGDAYNRSVGLLAGGGDKWPAVYGREGFGPLRVQVAARDGDSAVRVLADDGSAVRDARGRPMAWALPAADRGLRGFDPTVTAVQTVQISHALRAKLGLP